LLIFELLLQFFIRRLHKNKSVISIVFKVFAILLFRFQFGDEIALIESFPMFPLVGNTLKYPFNITIPDIFFMTTVVASSACNDPARNRSSQIAKSNAAH
jgi:chromate transport protein ChrA